ncbi:WIAG-tail domain [Cohnella cholangitidis]|uniref:WIAG-tail domain n=1 Tax=Cohnella cholangitidis TaxID=2598458 RepID=A0A7G5BV31_9BACL|nr:WIAG-tail domain [Cohnella cholangitidis]QMV40815.1 WIAG-tail domain [Cohnella cholangitidis]
MTADHLADGSVSGAKLEYGSVTGEHLADGSISGARLEYGSVTGEHLADGSVSGAKLEYGSVTADHLADGSIGGAKLECGSVTGEHLADGSVDEEKLSFQPVIAPLPGIGLLFGNQEFAFQGGIESMRIVVPFATSFADSSYTLIAMSDHASCNCVLGNKRPQEAELIVFRTRLGPEPRGTIQWIALGNKAKG